MDKQKTLSGESISTDSQLADFFIVEEKKKNLIPFLKWGLSDCVKVRFDKIPTESDIKQIPSDFGIGNFIEVFNLSSNQSELFKIDSIRLRSALKVLFLSEKFPLSVEIKRTGKGFDTTYSAFKIE